MKKRKAAFSFVGWGTVKRYTTRSVAKKFAKKKTAKPKAKDEEKPAKRKTAKKASKKGAPSRGGGAAKAKKKGSAGRPRRAKGTLRVLVSSDSVFLGGALRIDVYDASLTEVARVHPGEIDLPAGFYLLEGVLADGQLHRRIAEVVAGETVEASFEVTEPDRWSTSSENARRIELGETTSSGVTLLDSSAALSFTDRGDAVEVRYEAGEEDPPEPLHAFFVSGGTTFQCSLPMSGGFDSANRVCQLALRRDIRGRGDVSIEVLLPPERRVVRALHAMMAAGRVVAALDLAQSATELLRDKYSDPVGAAFGGLLLHRLGGLLPRKDWIENLARDFAWLPDAQILYAAVFSQDKRPERRAAAHDSLVLAAARMAGGVMPIFSGAYSLSLSLLKGWPEEKGRDARRAALGALAPRTRQIDFSYPFLLAQTRVVAEEEHAASIVADAPPTHDQGTLSQVVWVNRDDDALEEEG